MKDTKLPVSTKLYYGFGSMAFGIKDNAFAYFLLFVYVQVFGLSPDLAGLAILLMLVFDAISDPLVGYFSDNTKTKWGRRHPYIYLSALPVCISFFVLWIPPLDLTQFQLFSYLLLVGIFIRTSITFYEIPSMAPGPELSKDYIERSSLLAYRYWFGWWGGLAVWCSLWIFVVYSSYTGTTDARYLPSTWQSYGLACGVVMFIAIMVTALGTHRHIDDLFTPEPNKLSIRNTLSQLWETLTVSRDYLVLFLAGIITAVASGISTNLTLFYYSFFWEFTPLNILTIGLALFLTPFVGILISPYLAGKYGKRNTIIFMFLIAFVAENFAIFMKIFNLMPSNDTPYVLFIVLACHWIGVAAQIISYTTLGSMVFDTVEEVEKITGRRMEGTLLAARSFAAKCMSGAGAFLAGIVLSLSSWPSGAVAGEVDNSTIISVGIYALSISTCLWLLALFIFSKVKMTKASHEGNLDNLNYSKT
jgi:Na+/melibiose symporter-like transporter